MHIVMFHALMEVYVELSYSNDANDGYMLHNTKHTVIMQSSMHIPFNLFFNKVIGISL